MHSPTESQVFLLHTSSSVSVEEEYELFDANEIVSAVGGSLGLFLGFSCLGAYAAVARYCTLREQGGRAVKYFLAELALRKRNFKK